MLSSIFIPLAASLLLYGVLALSRIIHRELTSPLRDMVGPKSPNIVLGNFIDMMKDPHLTERWREEFGRNFLFRGLFYIPELHTSDIKALNHILGNSIVYQRSPSSRDASARLFGKGLLSLELDEHKRHRRILNQAFGAPQIRLLTDTFVQKASQLRDLWQIELAGKQGSVCIDVFSALRQMTLDVLGQAGFNYDFNAMKATEVPNELNQAFTDLFHSPTAERDLAFRVARSLLPILRFVPLPGTRSAAKARHTMWSVSEEIVSRSKAAIVASKAEKILDDKKDLLSVLLKSNLSDSLTAVQRLSDEEVTAQIPIFLLAGHETTSAAVSWALHALSLHLDVQAKLRRELFTISTENPTMDELNSLPYLENIVRETMRLHAPVVFSGRMAMQDDVLPLAKPYIDKHGRSHDTLPIRKGQTIHIPILAVNTDPEIWGEDAKKFNPERWEKLPEAVNGIQGVWANLLTFLAGPHNCIGFRFSLVEIKALIFTLIRAFEFEPAVAQGIIMPAGTALQRPTVQSGTDKASHLPLLVKVHDAQD